MNVALKKAVFKRVTIDKFDKYASGTEDYHSLAKEVVEEEKSIVTTFKETDFYVEAPHARDVFLVGDFNGWRIDDVSRLSKTDDGKWRKRISLTPGRYRYKFVVDGQWVLDSRNTEREVNSFGSFDSILKLDGGVAH